MTATTPYDSGKALSQSKTSFIGGLLTLPGFAAAVGCFDFIAHGISVLLGSERTVMEWLYDDSFYYMITAKHLSERHISSFDGVTVTSGYHPLWLWLCAAVYGLRDRLDLPYVRSCMALTFCITAVLLLLTLRHASVQRQTGLLWALALGASSYSALNNGVTPMEWPLVLLSWFLLHHVLITGAGTDRFAAAPPRGFLSALLLGMVGTLSRTDFGLIPACYFAAAILLGFRNQGWNSARRAGLALLGAAAGLPLVFLYNHRMTGSWLQSSAEVKHLAANLSSPFNPVPALWQFMRVLLYLPPLDVTLDFRTNVLPRVFYALLALAVPLAIWGAIRFRSRRASLQPAIVSDPAASLALIASVLGISAYLALDGFNSQATYGWYTAAVTGFVLILAANSLAKLKVRTAAAIVLPCLVANIAVALWFGGNAKSQMQEVYAGKAMRAQHPGEAMGGGDVGKPSFYNNGEMFNLDGLMNNEVVPYLAAGKIHCYILHRHIAYLSDIGSITLPVTDAERARRGQSPLPWARYFTSVDGGPVAGGNVPNGESNYLKTNFDAIRSSGECPKDE